MDRKLIGKLHRGGTAGITGVATKPTSWRQLGHPAMLELAESHNNCFRVEGELLDDGISMQIGGIEPDTEDFFNIRAHCLTRRPSNTI